MEASHTQATPGQRRSIMSRTAERTFFAASLIVFIFGVVIGLSPSLATPGLVLRWIGLAIFIPVGIQRRSLLVWTFYAMIAGVMLGLDAPHFAAQLRVFGALVTGIAGHSELKGLGRVAIKAIVFFEVVTTLGLILGLIAINLSHAGVGVALP